MREGLRVAARSAAAAGVACALALTFGGRASAATAIFSGPCPTYGDEQICSGSVPSFDGTMLDVDLTKPAPGTGTTHPLIVMLHGYGNNKHEWESIDNYADGADKYNWNSHWFSQHGYYVLTYTARGFRDDGPSEQWQPGTPSTSSAAPGSGPRATIHLKSVDTEVRDTQWVAALAAYSFGDIDRGRVAVTGGSYGGGETWLQASQAQWTFPSSQDSSLPVLQLQVAVPKYSWTDLAYSLAPNGHPGPWPGGQLPAGYCDVDQSLASDPCYSSSQGSPDSPTGSGNPAGVLKDTFSAGFYSQGYQYGGTPAYMSPADQDPCDLPGSSVDAWFARTSGVGEPYDTAGAEDPVVMQVRNGLTRCRSAYYQTAGWAVQAAAPRRVAIFAIQGWTDDLFDAVEPLRQFKYLKSLDPSWPVAVAVADVGHGRAKNNPDTWHYLNQQAWQWLQSQVGGSHDEQTTVTSEQTICDAGEAPNDPNQSLTARTPEALSNGKLAIAYARGGQTDWLEQDPNGAATDPVVGSVIDTVAPHSGSCPSSPGPSPLYTAVSAPLQSERTYVGLGSVGLHYSLVGTTAQIDARVWVVPPGPAANQAGSAACVDQPTLAGCPRLITHGTYRIDFPAYDGQSGDIRIPLFGNHYRFHQGDAIRLDISQSDSPYLRQQTPAVPATVTFGPPTLTLPTRESGTAALAGG